MLYHSITVDDHQLSVFALNANQPGAPIVFLHGITLAADFWLPSLPQNLAAPCYFISLPNHYPSRRLAGTRELTSETLAALLKKAIHKLVGDRPVVLVGYSVGGFAALNLAAHYPALVSRIVCIAGFARGQWQGLMGWLQWLCSLGRAGRWLFKLMYRLSVLHPVLYGWMGSLLAGDRRAYFRSPSFKPTLAALYPRLIRHNPDELAHLFRCFARMDISTILSQIQAPTLILAGDRDPVIGYEQTQLLVDCIPHVELRMLSGMGHMFFAERLMEYQHLLVCWIRFGWVIL